MTARHTRLSPWGRLVAASAVIVVGCGAALAIARIASAHERLVTYSVNGSLNGIALDLGDGDVLVSGGAKRDAVRVERVDRYAFGHHATAERSVKDGVFHVRSRCPHTVMHGCSVRYHLTVPDNVPVDVRTDSGEVSFRDYRGSGRVRTRSGAVVIDDYCGFSLQARAESGSIAMNASCPPQELSLRTTSGAVRAVVPAGRYRVDADSTSGSETIRGVASVADSPFSIEAQSSTGDVRVEARP